MKICKGFPEFTIFMRNRALLRRNHFRITEVAFRGENIELARNLESKMKKFASTEEILDES